MWDILDAWRGIGVRVPWLYMQGRTLSAVVLLTRLLSTTPSPTRACAPFPINVYHLPQSEMFSHPYKVLFERGLRLDGNLFSCRHA